MSSRQAPKFIMFLFLSGVLLSCDVFLSPRSGRWNTKDPEADLDPVSRSATPIEDTWTESPSTNDFSSLELKVQNTKYILIRFDIPAVPDIVTSARLELYCTTAGNGAVGLHRISQPWEADTLDPMQVVTPLFFDPTPITKITIDKGTGKYYSWEIGDDVGSLSNGILLMENESKESRFSSVEVISNVPHLIIEGYNKL